MDLGRKPASGNGDEKATITNMVSEMSLGTIHKGRPQNFRYFGPPPPLVRIFARSIRVNPRNLPYYVCFWTNPPPPSVRTSFMYGPYGNLACLCHFTLPEIQNFKIWSSLRLVTQQLTGPGINTCTWFGGVCSAAAYHSCLNLLLTFS